MMNHTHDPQLRSWVNGANTEDAQFPIQNLPFAVVRRAGIDQEFHCAVAIGDYALDLRALDDTGLVDPNLLSACQSNTLNAFMAQGSNIWSALRSALSELLAIDSKHAETVRPCLIPLSQVEYALPASIGDYTDFYTSIHHATNIGRLFRPDNPLLPNYQWIPIGYHGRSSSICVSGTDFPRPKGQLKPPDAESPILAPCARLDYELEIGIFIGPANSMGTAVAMEQAEQHVFGLCLLNDWSARDIQAWEYQPLGPFLAKNFASTVSPWIVTMEALAPFRAPWARDKGQPEALPYLDADINSAAGAVDMDLEVLIQSEQMRKKNLAPQLLSQSNFTDAYWTIAQMVTHHTINGCNLKPGDLLGSGTMSGANPGSQGALIEITEGGNKPIKLSSGETRGFLEDSDTIYLRARCARPGAVSIGFGEAVGTVLPAVS